MEQEKLQLNYQEKKDLIFKLRKETGLGLSTCNKCLKKYNFNYKLAKQNYNQFEWDGKLY
jgi:translation elongation factor EF-Ts